MQGSYRLNGTRKLLVRRVGKYLCCAVGCHHAVAETVCDDMLYYRRMDRDVKDILDAVNFIKDHMLTKEKVRPRTILVI
jgi:hypothetical protein